MKSYFNWCVAAMGLLRLFLAAIVVWDHLHPKHGVLNGPEAVEVFFLISGFLISFVLRKDDTYKSTYKFYANRALRIYPVYFAVALITFIMASIGLSWPGVNDGLSAESKFIVALTNVTIFGQDWIMFLGQHSGQIVLSSALWDNTPHMWRSLLIPPAWSLGLELTFYVIAPFVVRRRMVLLTLMVASLGAHIVADRLGLSKDPWNYRFFPFELWVFLLGALSEQMLLPIVKERCAGWPKWIFVLAAFATLIAFPLLAGPWPSFKRILVLIFTMAALMPGLFLFQRGRRWDTWLGDLSYPLYICHWLVLSATGTLASGLVGGTPQSVFGAHDGSRMARAMAAAISLVFAVLLEYLVAQPIEMLRRRIRGRSLPIDALQNDGPSKAFGT